MAGSNSEVTDITVTVLREIRDEVRSLRGEVKTTNQRLDRLREELRDEMHGGFESLGNRIDNLLLLGEHRHEHNELRDRVTRLEHHLNLPPIP
jgi:hypothetical protein